MVIKSVDRVKSVVLMEVVRFQDRLHVVRTLTIQVGINAVVIIVAHKVKDVVMTCGIGQGCCLVGETSCDSHCCAAGEKCCPDGTCSHHCADGTCGECCEALDCPDGTACCKNRCCAAGETCCPDRHLDTCH
jgi:hypothetical protein